jgi:hypothetical protein
VNQPPSPSPQGGIDERWMKDGKRKGAKVGNIPFFFHQIGIKKGVVSLGILQVTRNLIKLIIDGY